MSSQLVLGLRAASIVFGLLSIAQLMRLLIRPEIMAYDVSIPLWPSAVLFVVLACFSVWMWMLTTPTNREVKERDEGEWRIGDKVTG
jgi:hypothetical protein